MDDESVIETGSDDSDGEANSASDALLRWPALVDGHPGVEHGTIEVRPLGGTRLRIPSLRELWWVPLVRRQFSVTHIPASWVLSVLKVAIRERQSGWAACINAKRQTVP